MKYKTITVDFADECYEGKSCGPVLDKKVNEFLDNNPDYVIYGTPVVAGYEILQTLVKDEEV